MCACARTIKIICGYCYFCLTDSSGSYQTIIVYDCNSLIAARPHNVAILSVVRHNLHFQQCAFVHLHSHLISIQVEISYSFWCYNNVASSRQPAAIIGSGRYYSFSDSDCRHSAGCINCCNICIVAAPCHTNIVGIPWLYNRLQSPRSSLYKRHNSII